MPEADDNSDPILDGLHDIRRALLADSGGTLQSLVAQIQRHEGESRRAFVAIPISSSARATTEARGVTPEFLTEILGKDPGASVSPLASPPS